jgi:hypothetical protein
MIHERGHILNLIVDLRTQRTAITVPATFAALGRAAAPARRSGLIARCHVGKARMCERAIQARARTYRAREAPLRSPGQAAARYVVRMLTAKSRVDVMASPK